jgi:hypothetical protein
MSYSQFTFKGVKKQFSLTEIKQPLFPNIEEIPISDWLKKTLAITMTLSLNSEKARSEGIVAPFLFELQACNPDKIMLFSGEALDIDSQQGLNGECDFILSQNPHSTTIDAPIFCIVEAKQHIIEKNLGQCVAQMIGAREFNQIENTPINILFGAVTTGEIWQFLKLEDKTIYTDINRYYIENTNKIMGILQSIVNFYGK